jgi:hypothetical protein
MERAPAGSCPNDPTQPKCPKATKVIESPTVEQDDGAIAFAPGPAASATREARAAQWPWQCQLRLGDASPYKAAGYAQMDTSATCSVAVSAFELYGFLRKSYNGQWHNMASAADAPPAAKPSTCTSPTTARARTSPAPGRPTPRAGRY